MLYLRECYLGLAVVFFGVIRCARTGVYDSRSNHGRRIKRAEPVLNDRPPWWVFVLPAALSLIALMDLPYGYYQFLRIIVAGSCLWIAVWRYNSGGIFSALIFGALAILFNPVFKIHMEREAHSIFNVGTAFVLIAAYFFWARLMEVRATRDDSEGS